MKKLILFFVVVLIVGCSKDDNGASRNSDPIIGTWLDTSSNTNFTFQSNGRLTSNSAECSEDGVEYPFDLFWTASEENPDFTQVRREYRWTLTCNAIDYDEILNITAVFSDDFNRVYFVDHDFNGVRQ